MKRRVVRLVLASTCSDRKAAVASGRVELRSVPPLPADERAKRWAKQLALAATATTQADRLYLGPHWSASKRALDAACEAGLEARMYVVSAGYGLYPVDALVTSYAATFAPGHQDTVPPAGLEAEDRRNYLAAWWASVGKHVRLPGVKVRTFAQMATADPDQRILVVAGGHYLDAISQDLADARQRLRKTDFLSVVSAGASERAARVLGDSLLPVDARFEHIVSGARTALNARVAQWLLGEVINPEAVGASYFRLKLERKSLELPPTRKFNRMPMTNEEVYKWILSNADREEATSATSMLRFLRTSELACEQKRFGTLFNRALRGHGGNKSAK